MILRRYFERKKNGFYIDVGAHHPQRFSNTYFFYLRGWNGINIDPIPEGMHLFNQLRCRDINLEIGISNARSPLTYYIFNEQALNTFSKEIADSRKYPYELIREITIETYSLGEVLDQWLPNGQVIDFLNIDVEGLDEEVLRSNDWEKYRPRIVLSEALGISSIKEAMNSVIAIYLYEKRYKLIAKTRNTLLFERLES